MRASILTGPNELPGNLDSLIRQVSSRLKVHGIFSYQIQRFTQNLYQWGLTFGFSSCSDKEQFVPVFVIAGKFLEIHVIVLDSPC